MISIKHRFTGQTLCDFDVGTIRDAAEAARANLEGANLRGANLDGADLRGANLDGANLRGANLYGANLEGANLYGANLDGADLRGANLDGANLRGANLDGETLKKAPIVISSGFPYRCLISDGFMRLGCQRHTHAEWASFSDSQILQMDGREALKFWRQWGASLLSMCASHAPKQVVAEPVVITA